MEAIRQVVAIKANLSTSEEWAMDTAAFVDAIRQPIWRLNAAGCMVAGNQYLREYAGASIDADRLIHSEDSPAFWREVSSHSSRTVESRLRRIDGSYRWHRLTLTPESNGDCLVVGVELPKEAAPGIGIVQDVSEFEVPSELLIELNEQLEMKVAEQTAELRIAMGELVARIQEKEDVEAALRRSEAWFRIMADTVPHMVWSTTPEGHYDFCNLRWFDFLGVDSVEEADDMGRFLHPEDLPRMRQCWSQSLETGEPYETEYRLRRKDGVYRWILARGLPLRDEEGKVVRWFGSCTDIEDRKLLQQNESAERERLRLALEAARAGAWEFDFATKSFLWSEEMYELHGIPHNLENPGTASLVTIHPNDRSKIRHAVTVTARGGKGCDFEFRVNHPKNGLRWLRARGITLFDAAGKPTRVVGITEDHTDRKLAEQELERRVAERTKELEGFTYTVSHDLRAPLRALISTSRILIDEAGTKLSSEERRLLERQAYNASRLGTLIDELLQLTRLSRQEMRRQETDLTAIARDAADEMQRKTWPAPIYFEIEEGLRAYADPAFMKFVIQNLLENACKFSPQGGTVRFYNVDGAFCVSDEGIGFDPKYSNKLFLPFERLVTNEQFPGTGIGLATVRRIIERHDGHVRAEGEPNKGARFYFTVG